MTPKFSLLAALLVAAVASSLPACRTQETGTAEIADPAVVEKVHEGQSRDEVREILGDPYSVEKRDGAETWVYRFQESKTRVVFEPKTASGEQIFLNVTFGDEGLVQKVERTTRKF